MKRTKLHIGSGKRNFGPEWIHIDGEDYDHIEHKDILHLPLAANSMKLIYASHVIEYFDRTEIMAVLSEWKRTLKPGGKLRLAVPDMDSLIKIYKDTNNLGLILGPLFGQMKMGDKTIYHKTCYNFKDLEFILENAGFKDIKLWDWRKVDHGKFDDHSQAYFPHMDKERGQLVSLNVEATK